MTSLNSPQTSKVGKPRRHVFPSTPQTRAAFQNVIARAQPSSNDKVAKMPEVTAEAVEGMENLIRQGRQRDLVEFFKDYTRVPPRMGEWDIRVNIRHQDEVEVSRTIVALPLTVATRAIFEAGCIQTLLNAGYSQEEATWYYKCAWKKKYVWVDTVIVATKELIDAFQTSTPLENYETAGDPRRVASTVGVPSNPYLTSHTHFLVAVTMAKSIIRLRQKKEEVEASRIAAVS